MKIENCGIKICQRVRQKAVNSAKAVKNRPQYIRHCFEGTKNIARRTQAYLKTPEGKTTAMNLFKLGIIMACTFVGMYKLSKDAPSCDSASSVSDTTKKTSALYFNYNKAINNNDDSLEALK